MNLGLFLSPGDSLAKQQKTGQLDRLVKYYLQFYSKSFKQIYLFSYGDRCQDYSLPSNIILVPKPRLVPNYFYQLILVFIHRRLIKTIDIFRVFQTPGGLPTLLIQLFFHKPYIVTYGYDYVFFAQQSNQPIIAFLLKLITPLVLSFAKKVIVTTPANLRISRSTLIPNGVDPDQFIPLGKRQKLILSVGRLEPQKNYSLLIKAISHCQSKLKLVIIGQGSLKNTLLNQAEKLGVNLVILDNLAHSRLIDWYQRCAVYVLTSNYEGHPKTLLEAMSCACPIITTQFFGNPITHLVNGLVCGSRQALTVSIKKLLQDNILAQRLGFQARQTVLSQYNIIKLVSQEVKLLSF